MIIWAGEPSKNRESYHYPVAWRWTLQLIVERKHRYAYLGFVRQAQHPPKMDHSPGEWFPIRMNGITFTPFHWSWGADHMWYDGPHCSFSLGPIHFNWEPDSCDKCWDESHD